MYWGLLCLCVLMWSSVCEWLCVYVSLCVCSPVYWCVCGRWWLTCVCTCLGAHVHRCVLCVRCVGSALRTASLPALPPRGHSGTCTGQRSMRAWSPLLADMVSPAGLREQEPRASHWPPCPPCSGRLTHWGLWQSCQQPHLGPITPGRTGVCRYITVCFPMRAPAVCLTVWPSGHCGLLGGQVHLLPALALPGGPQGAATR